MNTPNVIKEILKNGLVVFISSQLVFLGMPNSMSILTPYRVYASDSGIGGVRHDDDRDDDGRGSSSSDFGERHRCAHCQRGRFQQPIIPNLKKLDLLFLMDPDASFKEDRSAVIAALVKAIGEFDPNLDLKVGLMLGHDQSLHFRPTGLPFFVPVFQKWKFDENRVLESKERGMDLLQSHLFDWFAACGIDQGGYDSLPFGLQPIEFVQTKGFFREDAVLEVIYLFGHDDRHERLIWLNRDRSWDSCDRGDHDHDDEHHHGEYHEHHSGGSGHDWDSCDLDHDGHDQGRNSDHGDQADLNWANAFQNVKHDRPFVVGEVFGQDDVETCVVSPSPSPSPSVSPSSSPTVNPSTSPTPSPTSKPSATPTPSPTGSSSSSPSPTASPSASPSSSSSGSPTPSPSASPSESPRGGPTSTPTPIPSSTASPTPTPTSTPSSAPTGQPTGSPTPQPSTTGTPFPTSSPTPTDTSSPVPTASPSPTDTGSPVPTVTPSPTDTSSPTPTPSSTPSPTPSVTPTCSGLSCGVLGS